MPDRTLLKTFFRNDSNYWTAFNGTSMASPHVTGIVALMLEANPALSAEQVREILISTASSDASTGTTPNIRYGYGKVNAYAAVAKALQYAGINEFYSGAAPDIYPNPANNVLYIASPALDATSIVSIVGIDGRTVIEVTCTNTAQNIYSMDMTGIAQGIYFVKFFSGGQLFISKFIKT